MANLETLILRDIAANRPAAAIAGRLFYDTDNEKWQRDTGAAWEDCEPAGGSSDTFKTISVAGQSDVVADAPDDTLTLAAGANVTITTDPATDKVTIAAVAATVNSFSTIKVSGQSDVVADSATDSLTLVAGSNVTITTNATTDAITIAATGGADVLGVQVFS